MPSTCRPCRVTTWTATAPDFRTDLAHEPRDHPPTLTASTPLVTPFASRQPETPGNGRAPGSGSTRWHESGQTVGLAQLRRRAAQLGPVMLLRTFQRRGGRRPPTFGSPDDVPAIARIRPRAARRASEPWCGTTCSPALVFGRPAAVITELNRFCESTRLLGLLGDSMGLGRMPARHLAEAWICGVPRQTAH